MSVDTCPIYVSLISYSEAVFWYLSGGFKTVIDMHYELQWLQLKNNYFICYLFLSILILDRGFRGAQRSAVVDRSFMLPVFPDTNI